MCISNLKLPLNICIYKDFIAPPQHMHEQLYANLVYFSPFLLYQRQNSRRIKHMCKYNKDKMFEGKDARTLSNKFMSIKQVGVQNKCYQSKHLCKQH